ncbi:MAG: ABC transporter permease [Acidobacteriia bacterium]|nr:ABC transporter permease [Terriglobia bacterium]
MANSFQDIRYGIRMIMKAPGYAALAILTLALGIGANAAIFSVADPLLLRPVPFPNLNRLALVFNQIAGVTNENSMYPADYEAIRTQSRSFEEFAAYANRGENLIVPGGATRLQAARVTPNFFKAVAVQPVFGRGFLPEERIPGHDAETILSYSIWQSQFGGNPKIIGTETRIDGQTYTIVGVMGKDFQYPPGTELWHPLALDDSDKVDRSNNYLFPIGLLKSGVSVSQAAADLEIIGGHLQQEFPRSNSRLKIRVVRFQTYATDELTHNFMLLLLGAVGFVLLIACANVANLQLARGAGRWSEIAVRAALGASRWRVVRQLLVESITLALIGAVAGLFMAEWAVSLIVSNMPAALSQYVAGWNRIALDWRAVAFTATIAVFAGILAGIAPALSQSRPDVTRALKEGGRGGSPAASHRLRSLLVVAEVAASLVLLIGAGLLVKGFRSMMDANERFSPQNLLTAAMVLPKDQYSSQTQLINFYDQALSQIAPIPGVESGAISTAVPNQDNLSFHPFTGDGKAWKSDLGHIAMANSISPNYFRTLHLPLLQGREFTRADGPNSQRVAIVNRGLAERYWPGENAIGKRIKQGQPDSKLPWLTIVGVVSDVKYNPYFRSADGAVYVPYSQQADMNVRFLLRTTGDPLGFVSALRMRIHQIDPEQPVYEPKTLARLAQEEMIGISYIASMMAVLGFIALVLASSGVYGVMAHGVTERTHEIGIRLALGAEPNQVLQWITRRGILLVGTGLTIGFAIAFMLARLLASLIFGVSATDPLVFVGFSLVLGAVGLLACFIPARRATRVDPMVALRYE